jgi:hypothetical protein
MQTIDLLIRVHGGSVPSIFKELDFKSERNEYDTVADLVADFPKLISGDDEFRLVIKVLNKLTKLENYLKWIEHPIYINDFKDKYGNTYLQARTSIKDHLGKTKWVSAYIGTLKDYPKGINDIEASKKGKTLIRKKLKKYFDLN